MSSNFRFGSRGGFWRVGASFVQDFANRDQVIIDDNIQTAALHKVTQTFMSNNMSIHMSNKA